MFVMNSDSNYLDWILFLIVFKTIENKKYNENISIVDVFVYLNDEFKKSPNLKKKKRNIKKNEDHLYEKIKLSQ